MAARFVRLKLTLLRNGFRRGWQQAVGLVLGALVALPLALTVAAVLAVGGRSDADFVGPLLVLGSLVLTAGWVIGPLAGFGLDETLDPGRLQLLPLSGRQLVTGLLAASLVGIAPIATAIALSGLVIGFSRGLAGTLIVTLAAAAQLLVCLLAARCVVTVLSRRLRSRRGRELTGALLTLVLASAGLFAQVPQLLAGADPDALGRIARVAGWLPPAWPAQAAVAVRDGQPVEALAWLAASALLVAALAAWWLHGLAAMTQPPPVGRGPRRGRPLVPAPLATLLPPRIAALAARDLRYLVREPQLAIVIVFALGAAVALTVTAWVTDLGPRFVLAAGAVAWLPSATSLNALAADRAGWWLHVSLGVPAAEDLLARTVARAALALPAVALAAIGMAAATGGWADALGAVLLGAAVVAVSGGVGAVASVMAPTPLPEGTNPFQARAGQGCATALVQTVAFSAEGLVLGPLALLTFLAALRAPGLLLVVIPVSLAAGVTLCWAGTTLAAGVLERRRPEILAVLATVRG